MGKRRTWMLSAAAIAALLIGIGLGFAIVRRGAKSVQTFAVQLQVAPPENARFGWLDPMALAPDGQRIAFSATVNGKPQLFLRSLNALSPTPVPGGEGGGVLFWSPDGTQIGFEAAPGVLKRFDLAGGPAQTLCPLGGPLQGATWSRQNVIVFAENGRLFRISARGGEPKSLGPLLPGETARCWPQFLPDGRHYLYLSLTRRPEDQGVYVGDLGSDIRKRIVAAENNAAYSPSGHLLFIKDEVLVAQPFDVQRLELSGEPFPVVEHVARLTGTTTAGLAHFSVSANGVLAWRPGPLVEPMQLTWFDRSGKTLGTLGEPANYFAFVLSPDEQSVAVCRMDGATNRERDLWIIDVQTGVSRRLTFDPHDNCSPTWSPDGSKVAFFSDRRGVREIYQKLANGSGDDELLLASNDFPLFLDDWSPDGRFLVYTSPVPPTEQDLFLLPLSAGDHKPVPFLATAAIEREGRFAPSGRHLAYLSTESGRREIYVRDITRQGSPGPGKWQISHGGGSTPRWRRDGKELFYLAGSVIMAVEVKDDGAGFETGPPRPLGVSVHDDTRRFDVTRDGQRLLAGVTARSSRPIYVLVNWLAPRER